MLFPELVGKDFSHINLNQEAERWLQNRPRDPNPLLDPAQCQAFIDDCHRRYRINFSYGDWMKDRATFLRGTYLDTTGGYIHLGIDFNVPAGTLVAVPHDCTVLRVDNDHPELHGWGTRVIVDVLGRPVVLVFAHLDPDIRIKADDRLRSGTVFAKVGTPSYNGNWFPHLHLQAIKREHYTALLADGLRTLDGYGHERDLELLKQQFPDPWEYVSL